MSKRKVLILRFSSIGDIVLTTPVMRNLKTQVEEYEVHYCTKAKYASLLRNNPYVEKLHLLEDHLSDLIARLKQENFDYVIDLHNNLRTRIIRFFLGKKCFVYNKLNRQKWLMVNLKINQLPNRHIVDRYLDTLKPLKIKPDALGLDYFIPEKEIVTMDMLPATHRKEYVVYAIGGQHATKKLPVDRMIELCDKINKPVILIGGREDEAVGQTISRFFERTQHSQDFEEGLQLLGKKTEVFNACGKFSINQSASIIKQAKYVFSHDTGMMHIAAAFKKEIFSIWGNTIPLFGMYPYRTKFIVLENNRLDCRPCSKIGYDKCPKGHFKCMRDQVFDFYLP